MGDGIEVAEAEAKQKIELVKAAIGYRLTRHAFSNDALATVLGIRVETVSRKRNGKAPMMPDDWARLFAHFGLAGTGLPSDILTRSAQDLDAALKAHGVGIHGEDTMNRLLQKLLDYASGADPNVAVGGMTIERLGMVRRGGIGGGAARRRDAALTISDRVRLHVESPGNGTMVIVNSEPQKEITCLMPSSYAPNTNVSGGGLVVPDPDDLPHLPVSEPFGDYRLFAIWFARPPDLALLRHNEPEIDAVTPRDLKELVAAIEVAARVPGAVSVAARDYEVLKH